MIPQPKFIPGQEVFLVWIRDMLIRKEKIDAIEWEPADGIKEGFWKYLFSDSMMGGYVLHSNFSEVMEVLNG